MRERIQDPEWSDCLNRLRDARALVLRDAESFHEAAMALERVGQVLGGKIKNGLGGYKEELLKLAGGDEPATRLFDTVREARNQAVHEGAWARHLSSRLVDFILILEQAMKKRMQCAEDLMVRQPVVAEPWQMIAHVRQAMLANSFSSLPVLHNDQWYLISDLMIMRYLRRAGNDAKERPSQRLESVWQDINPVLAKCMKGSATIAEIAEQMDDHGLVLITDDSFKPPRLLGVLSAFDLL